MQQRKEPTGSHDMEEPQQQKEDTDVELNDEHDKWERAAEGLPPERLRNGCFPCSGYNGIVCKDHGELSANEERCFKCKMELLEHQRNQHCQKRHNSKDQQAGEPNEDKLRKRVAQERLDAPTSVTTEENLRCLEACKSVAETLCKLGEQGFHHILHKDEPVETFPMPEGQWWPLLLRLARCADNNKIDKDLRKYASHCGSLDPDFDINLLPLKGTPDCADAGNDIYSKVVRKLIFECEKDIRMASDHIRHQIEHLGVLNSEHRGDVIECALGAAMYAHAVENKIPFKNYSMLRGGTWASSDLPT